MSDPRDITLDRGWVILLRDVGVAPEDVLRRAGLSEALLSRESTRLTVQEYFSMVHAAEELAQDPLLPLRLGQSASPEAFSPPIFAALCSPNLTTAARRIAAHKRLMAPMHLRVVETEQEVLVSWEWDDPSVRPPRLLMAMELVFLTQLARIGTRERIRPRRVVCPVPLEPAHAFATFFGAAPELGPQTCLAFSAADAQRPFLTASDALWQSFEPELQRRVRELDVQASAAVRTRSMLLECLPSGQTTLPETARRMGVSSRTLQRRLASEGVSFREVLQATRERLARHYLTNTQLTYGEVAFLIGFDEPTSFFRAFREWTGQTPERVRQGGA